MDPSYDEVIVVRSGEFTVDSQDGCTTAGPGELVWVRASVPVTFRSGRETTWIAFATYPIWDSTPESKAQVQVLQPVDGPPADYPGPGAGREGEGGGLVPRPPCACSGLTTASAGESSGPVVPLALVRPRSSGAACGGAGLAFPSARGLSRPPRPDRFQAALVLPPDRQASGCAPSCAEARSWSSQASASATPGV